jgi:phosphatidylglycerol lysyltransferase
MGRFDPHTLGNHWLAVAWNPEARRVEAFVSWVRIPARQGWAIDLMRRRNDAPTGVMEFLVVKSVEAARAHGDAIMSLALSALVSVDDPVSAAPEAGDAGEASEPVEPVRTAAPPSTTDLRDYPRVREFLMQHLARFYDFQNLFRWKRKFDPVYEDRYLVYPSSLALPQVALALVRAQSPGGLRAYFQRS